MKRLLTMLVVFGLIVSIALGGCSQSTEESESAEQAEETKVLKVACLMSGPINDQGWNATAFQGLKLIEKEFGVEISYNENIAQSDMENVFINYAQEGYACVFGHGFEFNDAAIKVAKDYPDTKFIIVSGANVSEPNLASLNVDNYGQGFLQGIVAGLITKTNVIGYVGGMEIPPIQDSLYGYEAGAKYVNPDVEVLSAFTGNFEDTAAVKELSVAIIDQGADVMMADAAQAGLGGIEAAKEKGILYIGSNADQHELAPDVVVTSGIDDLSECMKLVCKEVLDGKFKAQEYVFGIREGAVYLSPYHGFEDKLDSRVKQKIADITKEIVDGKLDIMSLKKQ